MFRPPKKRGPSKKVEYTYAAPGSSHRSVEQGQPSRVGLEGAQSSSSKQGTPPLDRTRIQARGFDGNEDKDEGDDGGEDQMKPEVDGQWCSDEEWEPVGTAEEEKED